MLSFFTHCMHILFSSSTVFECVMNERSNEVINTKSEGREGCKVNQNYLLLSLLEKSNLSYVYTILQNKECVRHLVLQSNV